MATTIDTSSNPLAAYGYDAATAQKLAQQLGMTTDQLAAAFAATPMSNGTAPQTTSYGMTTGGGPGGRDLQSTINQLQIAKAAGVGQQQSGPPGSIPGQVSNDPMNAAVNLGAAALNMPAVYNPTPGQIPAGSKGGIAQVASPVSSGSVPTVPSGPWSNNAGPLTSPGQAAAAQLSAQYSPTGQPNSNPANNALFYQGMTGQNPNQYQGPAPASGGVPIPTRPVNAAGSQPATPWATAPAAPGASVQPGAPDWQAMGMHTTGLESAGKALYSHFGGDPNTATHAQINDFHNQLLSNIGAMSQGGAPTPFGQAPPGAANYTAGTQPGVPATGATPGSVLGITPPPGMGSPAKMATGGLVPGQGNRDTVPALLTPGEYVIPKQQAAQIFGGRTPIRMQDGGFVPDDQQKKNPSEVPRMRLTTPGSPPPAPSQGGPTSSGQQSPDSAAPAAPTNQGYWSNLVNQAQAANMGSGGPGSIDSLGTLGDEGLANQAIGGTGANTAAGVADVAGGLVSGLQKAVDAYAKSIKPWQWEKKDFGEGGTPNYQNTTFQQPQVA